MSICIQSKSNESVSLFVAFFPSILIYHLENANNDNTLFVKSFSEMLLVNKSADKFMGLKVVYNYR